MSLIVDTEAVLAAILRAAKYAASGVAAICAAVAMPQTKFERIDPSPKQIEKIQALTPEEVASHVDIKDDDLEPVATLTTEEVYRSNGKFTDPVRSDNFVRAFVDKTTGTVQYQLYESVSYNNDWRNFFAVNFATASGLQTEQLVDISHEVTGCFDGLCSFEDHVGFDLTEGLMATIASQYVPGDSPLWRFRLKAKNGVDWEDRISPAEVAGLLLAVRCYKRAHSLLDK